VERQLEFIEEAMDYFPSVRMLVLTGGEAFLLGDGLNKLVSKATELGLPSRIVTNGYWGNTRAAARKRLAKLQECGLGEVNFSIGVEHQQYVPIRSVLNAILEAVDLGITVAIMVEIRDGQDIDLTGFIEEGIPALVDQGKVLFVPSPWMSFTPGKEIPQNPLFVAESKKAQRGCNVLYNTISFTPAQKLFACCGLPMEDLDELMIADLSQGARLKDQIEQTPDDYLKAWIHVQGPQKILEYAREKGFLETVSAPVHICDACRSLYRTEGLVEKIFADGVPEPAKLSAKAFARSCMLPKGGAANAKMAVEVMKSASSWEAFLKVLEAAGCGLKAEVMA
jgi:hypothetical protein